MRSMPSRDPEGLEASLIDMKYLVSLIFSISIFAGTILSQGGGTISGTVRLGAEETVLHEVSVRIVELKQTVTTDQSGQYSFKNIPAGKYTLVAHQEGFSDVSKKVDVTVGGAVTADFQLQISGVKEEVCSTALARLCSRPCFRRPFFSPFPVSSFLPVSSLSADF